MNTTVVNKHYDDFDIDITRGTPFGNPYPIGEVHGTRDEVITKCRREQGAKILKHKEFRDAVRGLRGSRLGCVCHPQPCHGDFLAEVCNLGVVDVDGGKTKPPIMEFQGEYRFLSNMWLCDKPIRIGKVEFATVEHYYQSQKTLDPHKRVAIHGAITPIAAKRLGRKVDIRPDWNTLVFETMAFIVMEKFAQDEELGDQLLATEDTLLIEGNNWHDNFWGRCTCERCGNFGLNHLGQILMYVRMYLPIWRREVAKEAV